MNVSIVNHTGLFVLFLIASNRLLRYFSPKTVQICNLCITSLHPCFIISPSFTGIFSLVFGGECGFPLLQKLFFNAGLFLFQKRLVMPSSFCYESIILDVYNLIAFFLVLICILFCLLIYFFMNQKSSYLSLNIVIPFKSMFNIFAHTIQSR